MQPTLSSGKTLGQTGRPDVLGSRVSQGEVYFDLRNPTDSDMARLNRLAMRWVRAHDAEEMVARLLLKACKSRTLIEAHQPAPFVRQMMYSVIVDHWRSEQTKAGIASLDMGDHVAFDTATMLDRLVSTEEVVATRKAIAALPDEYRQYIEFRLAGMTTQAIASKMGCCTSSVRQKQRTAKQLLRAYLVRSGFCSSD